MGSRNVHYYDNDGIKMSYGRVGEGPENLVLLPGLSVQPVSGAIDILKNRYKVFLNNGYSVWIFDRRENVPEDYSFSEMAEDTVKVMKDLGIEKADILGMSQGGMLALCIAENHPELVNRLTVSSTGGRVTDMLRECINRWLEMEKQKDKDGLAASFVDWMFGEKTLSRGRDFILSRIPEYTEEELKHFHVIVKAFDSMDLLKDPRKISCPVLVIGCQNDRVVGPDASLELQKALGCEMYMYGPEYGHAVYDEAPDFVQRVMDFFRPGPDRI